MVKIYTDEFLINELLRFVNENNRVPKAFEMTRKNGYPPLAVYYVHFGSFNNSLEIANLEINKTFYKRTKNETCCICNNYLKQGQNWITKGLQKGQVMCLKCYYKSKSNYMNDDLDKNSSVAKGFIGQRVVAKTLGLELKDDCNCSVNFGHPYDLYDKNRYGKIDVKTSQLNEDYNRWKFYFTNKYIPDTYICLGFDKHRKNILHVWICKPTDDLLYNKNKRIVKKGITIPKALHVIKKAKPGEVNPKPYNDMLHSMSQKRKTTNDKECVLSNDDLRK